MEPGNLSLELYPAETWLAVAAAHKTFWMAGRWAQCSKRTDLPSLGEVGDPVYGKTSGGLEQSNAEQGVGFSQQDIYCISPP